MLIQRFYLQCLAHASYIIADEASGEAAIVDPQRDTDQYEAFLAERGLRLKYVLETHLHADFVSGHVELAEKTGAEIVFSHQAGAHMDHRAVADGDRLTLGDGVSIEVLETPGHTPESVCYLARETGEAADTDRPGVLFSGDTVFVGDVGRPDLLGDKMTPETLASMMYDTIQNKIKTLPGDTLIYPAHGEGSSCGRALGSDEFSTVARESETNYAFKTRSREDFIAALTVDQPEAPKYFSEDARLNRAGVPTLQTVLEKLVPLSATEVKRLSDEGVFLLDTRDPEQFARGSLPGAVNIALDGAFASWVGQIVPGDGRIVLIAEEESEVESAMRCARIGYDGIAGFLSGGVEAWQAAGLPLIGHERLEATDLATIQRESSNNTIILDVRKASERETCRLPNSEFISLTELTHKAGRIKRDVRILVYCHGGYRSSIAVGLLRKLGFAQVTDLRGGIAAYRDAGHPVERPETALA